MKRLVALAQENAALNGIECRAMALDVAAKAEAFAAAGLAPDSADRVLMNPPFNDAAGISRRRTPAAARRTRRAASMLDVWIHAARRLLKSGGTLTLIWRADGVGDVLAALGRGFGGYCDSAGASEIGCGRHSRAGQGGERIGAPLTLLPGFVLNDEQTASRRRKRRPC